MDSSVYVYEIDVAAYSIIEISLDFGSAFAYKALATERYCADLQAGIAEISILHIYISLNVYDF